MSAIDTILEQANAHKVGLGTVVAVIIVLMWGSYELGSTGWNKLNVTFVDHAEADDTEQIINKKIDDTSDDLKVWVEIRDKNKNVRMMNSKVTDYEIQKARDGDPGGVIAGAIIGLEANIELEEEAVTCLETRPQNECKF
jgi:hypothetical protein